MNDFRERSNPHQEAIKKVILLYFASKKKCSTVNTSPNPVGSC